MAQYLKKTSLGRLVVAEDGIADQELTEVRLTAEEYKGLCGQIKISEEKANTAFQDANTQIVEHQKQTDDNIACYQAKIGELEKEKLQLQDTLEKQKDLNKNLKRIAKERANAKRGLTPKKERSGYIVLFSSQYKERYFNKNGAKCAANTWKTVLQTPYDSTIILDLVKDEIMKDLLREILYPMGFRQIQSVEKNGTFRRWYKKDADGNATEYCGIYRWDYKANYKKGLWEITLYHTMSISVPEEYRPPQ